LDAGQRRRVETAMVAGRLTAVVCTSTLDLGIDWGDAISSSTSTLKGGKLPYSADWPSQSPAG
jgi:hypothetical protein